MQSMTAGAREQEVAHAVFCGEERETVEKESDDVCFAETDAEPAGERNSDSERV